MNANSPAPNSQNKAITKEKSLIKTFGIYFSVILLVAGIIYFLICSMTYSEGSRMGILYKISKKGYVFKTYEGEIHIGGMYQSDGKIMPPTIFKFSIKKDDRLIYEKLDSLQGQKVVVQYRQIIKNFFWQGESNYFVYDGHSVE